jgi:hypothetical protein
MVIQLCGQVFILNLYGLKGGVLLVIFMMKIYFLLGVGILEDGVHVIRRDDLSYLYLVGC